MNSIATIVWFSTNSDIPLNLYWTNEHLTDDVIDEWYDENREDQENYFEITAKMNDMIREEFPNINPAYIEEIADDRYTAYLERSCYEDPDDIPEVLEEEPVKEEGFEDEKKEDE